MRHELRARVRCQVDFDAPLARMSTYRIGGPAAAVVSPTSAADVSAVVSFTAEAGVPWFALGLGSNLLFADEGYDGVVIRLGKELASVRMGGPEETVWTVGAGLPTPLLAKRTAAAGMSGLHRLVGVPGSVGGGVFMNAGAHGQEFQDVVESVSIVDESGEERVVSREEIPWAYRRSGLEGVVVSAKLRFSPADPQVLQREFKRYITLRREKTPFDRPCCGSVFQNPDPGEVGGIEGLNPPYTAGRLIEAVGLKGFSIGGAEVSPMHANYIVNVGGASAGDVRGVVSEVQQRVRDRFGVVLKREVKFIDTGTGAHN